MKKYFLILFVFALLIAACTQQPIVNDNAPGNMKNVEMIKNSNTRVTEIETSEVDYGSSIGFFAKPKGDGKYPAVVMIHEWWGLNDNIKDMAKQLAMEGYVVLAVDLYEGKVARNSSEAGTLAGKARNNLQSSVANMKAAIGYLKSHPNYNGKIASMGWCFGGQMSLQLALNEELDATVIYYGSLETNASKLEVIDWPVLGIFGEADTSIPTATVNQFDAALDQLRIENEIYIYPGVGHAFANPSGMNYAPNETKDAWRKTVEFLNRHLK